MAESETGKEGHVQAVKKDAPDEQGRTRKEEFTTGALALLLIFGGYFLACLVEAL